MLLSYSVSIPIIISRHFCSYSCNISSTKLIYASPLGMTWIILNMISCYILYTDHMFCHYWSDNAFFKISEAWLIASRAAGVSASTFSVTNSWVVPRYLVAVSVTPTSMSLWAYTSPSERSTSNSSVMTSADGNPLSCRRLKPAKEKLLACFELPYLEHSYPKTISWRHELDNSLFGMWYMNWSWN